MASVRPSPAAAGRATAARRPNRPSSEWAKATVVAAPVALRLQDPRLIGEVTLNRRSMFRKRSGRPRSEISSGGLAAIPAMAARQARRASTGLPARPAPKARPAEAPAIPPTQK